MKIALRITASVLLLMLIPQDSSADVRFMLNLGPEQFVQADSANIEVAAYSVPSYVDWNNDGRNDLIVGEKAGTLGKVRIYLNEGSAEIPEFTDYFYAQAAGSDLSCPASGCLGCFPRVVNWDHDGKKDLLVGQVDGKIQIFLNTGSDDAPVFDEGSILTVGSGATEQDLDVGARATPAFVDWDNDSRIDIITGGLDGKIHVYFNCGCSASTPAFYHSPPEGEFAVLNGGDLVVPTNRASPVILDLNNDGKIDILTGNTEGQLLFYENTGNILEPFFEGYMLVESDGAPINIAGSPRSRPFVCDWNDDGYLDVLIGSYDGKVRLYQSRGAAGDVDKDYDVDAFDYAVFAAAWKTTPNDQQWNRRCDVSDPNDQTINEFDLKNLTQNWLTTP